jgi:hypothetical protein
MTTDTGSFQTTARIITSGHDRVAWKYHHIGIYLLNDVLPPNHGQI